MDLEDNEVEACLDVSHDHFNLDCELSDDDAHAVMP
jgi:hypothetical protein